MVMGTCVKKPCLGIKKGEENYEVFRIGSGSEI